MHRFVNVIFIFCIWLIFCAPLFAQNLSRKDSGNLLKSSDRFNDTNALRKSYFNPKKASIRSAILPGWGQIYNKSYWKLPIIYTALGVTAYVFIDNLKTYKELRNAYTATYKYQVDGDPTDWEKLPEEYKVVSINSLKQNRNQFRQYVDYTALVFILFWGLNVLDASVDAHLKSFDVSPDLSLQIKGGYNAFAKTHGFTLAFKL